MWLSWQICGIDSQINFLALAIASKKLSKTVSETRAKWLRFGAVCETRGLAVHLYLCFTFFARGWGDCVFLSSPYIGCILMTDIVESVL